jgi:hypothetical protein
MGKLELEAQKTLSLNKEIKILQADKGNCTVIMDESEYRNKLNTMPQSGVYESLTRDPTAKIERKGCGGLRWKPPTC